jgi:uncharacterized protein DUF4007
MAFSGHESFICKQFWLKKGFDFINSGHKFNMQDSVVQLGVGKNMVSSIKFWMKSCALLKNDDKSTELSEYIFGKNGKDKYLEDYGTIWLLHYHLIKENFASIYHLFFNEFRKERIDFTKEQLHLFLKRKCKENKIPYSENTIKNDINVFLKNYLKPSGNKIDIEHDYSGLLIDLNVLKTYKSKNSEDKLENHFIINIDEKNELPFEIVLYSILDNLNDNKIISFRELQINSNSPELVFGLNSEGLFNKLIEISKNYKTVIVSENAGNRTIQFKEKIDKMEVLNNYYD